MIGMLIGV